MDDRASIELREEPSEATDELESGRRAIGKEAKKSILVGGGIVLLHLGGLIAGAICGAVMIKRDSQEMPIGASAALKVLGVASLLTIAGISLFSILKILHT